MASLLATNQEAYTVRRLSFAALLPLVAVLMWVRMIAIPTAIQYSQMVRLAHGSDTAHYHVGTQRYEIPRDLWLSFSADRALAHSTGVLTAVNLPGIVIVPLIDWLKSGDGLSWTPEGMFWKTWRAIILTIGCVPFWAIAGFGMDGILRLRRLRWFWLAAGTVLCVLFLVGTCGMVFGLPPEDRADMHEVIGGFIFWTILLATFPAYWVRMGVDRRRLRRQSNTVQV